MSRIQNNAIRSLSARRLREIPLLSLVTVLSVIAAGCTVATTALPELPPAPTISSGTFQIVNNFGPCPAGTPAPAGSQCFLSSPTGNVDVLLDAFLGSNYSYTVPTRGGTVPVANCQIQGAPVDTTGQPVLVARGSGASCLIEANPANNGLIPSTLPSLIIPTGGFAAVQMTLQAFDSSNPAATDTQDIVIRFFAGFSFGTSTLENGTQGRAYTKTITTNLGSGAGVPPLTNCTASVTPAGSGLSVTGFSGSSCTFSGTAGTAGTYSVTFTATDSASPPNPRTSGAIPLVINPPLSLSTPTYATGTSGRAFAAVTLTRTGGQTPITCSDGVTLPTGMTVTVTANNCVVSGTPTASGTFNVVITATDTATATTAAGSFSTPATQMIISPGLAITTVANTLLDAVNGRTYVTPAFTNSGGNAPFTWSATGLGSGACTGLTISAAGVVSGTPTTSGTCSFTATVADTATPSTPAGSTSGPFTITVRGEFALGAPGFVDGVEQRTYGNAPQQHLVATSPALAGTAGPSDFGQTAEIGNGPIATCAVTTVVVASGTPGTPLTTANFTAVVDPTNNSRCRVQSVGAFPTGSAATYTVTVTANDNAIGTFTPASTKANTGAIIVRPALALAVNLADPLPTAVTGRSYGQGNICGPAGGVACTPVIYTASGGIAPYTIGVSAGAFPAGFASVAAATTLTFSSGNVTGAATSPVTVAVTDTGNAAVPPAPAVPVTVVRNITVAADIILTPNAAGATPPDGVQGRPYGGTGFSQLVYTTTLGLGGYVYAAIPTIGAPGAGVPGTPGVVCSDTAGVMTCGSSGGTSVITAGPGAYTFTVRVTDTSNGSVPGRGFSPLGSLALTPTINVRGPLTLTPSAAAATAALPDAVEGRVWGQGAGCSGGSCLPAIYTATGGLGATTSYVFTVPSPFPGGAGNFPCLASATSVPGDTLTCSTAAVASGAGAFPAPFTPTIVLNDTGNATTPSAPGPLPTSLHTMNVQGTFTVTANATQAGGTQAFTADGSSTNPNAVQGRAYGPSLADPTRVNLLFDKTAGLTPYIGAVGAPPFPFNQPTGFACFNASLSQVSCHTNGAALGAGTASGTPYLYAILYQDGFNASVPRGSVTITSSLTVNNEIALAAGSPAPTSLPLPTARQNSSYGTAGAGCSGGACAPVTFTVDPTTGLGTALTIGNSGFPAGISCVAAANVLTCSSANVTAGAAAFAPQVTVNDTANATVTDRATANGGTPFTRNETMTVVNDLVIDAGAAFTFAGGNGTISRNFGTGTGIGAVPPNVDVAFTGGISAFTCSGNAAFTALGLTATTSGNNCRLTGAPNSSTGPFNLTITVTDSNNASTPTDTSTTVNKSLTVNAALTLAAPTLNAGVTGQVYADTVTAETTGGQTAYSWTVTGAGWVAGTPFTNATGACAGFTFDGATGAFGGTPTGAGTCGLFTITVNDSQTTTTGTAAATGTAGLASQLVSIAVNAPVGLNAWVGGPEDSATQGRAIGGGSGGTLDYVITGGSGSFTCTTDLPGASGLSPKSTPVAAVNLGGGVQACRLLGTPNASDVAFFVGVNTVTITVLDTNTLQTDSQTTAAFVVEQPLMINGDTTNAAQVYPTGVRTKGYAFDVTPAGGNQGTPTLSNPNGGATLSTADATDCAGLTFSASAPHLNGPPTAPAATCTFDLAVNDNTTNMSLTATLTQASNTITTVDPLAITTVQGNLVNGLVGAPYNSGNNITFNTNNAGVGTLAWFDPNDGAGATCAAPTGTLRFAAGDFSTAGVLSGSPTSASTATNETFEICVEDSGNAAVSGYAATPVSFAILVMNRYIYVADPGADRVNVIDSATDTEVDTDGGGSPFGIALTSGDDPEDVAVSPNGRRAFVTASGTNFVRVIDTISHAIIDNIDVGGLTPSCTGPLGIAAERVSGTTDRVYVACTNGVVVTFDANAATPISATSFTLASPVGVLDSVTFSANATHNLAYFTDFTNDVLYAVDTTGAGTTIIDLGGGNEFALTTTDGFGSDPRGILSVINGGAGATYLYVAMDNDDSASDSWVQIFSVNTTTGALTAVGTPLQVSATNNESPQYFAHDNLSGRDIVYVTMRLNGNARQIGNATTTPTASSSSNNPPAAVGVTIPPVTGRLYVSGAADRVDHFLLTALGVAPSGGVSIDLDGATTPRRIKHIPNPR